MRWSKNITEERAAPEQIILASMDARACPLLNLAVYLEVAKDTVHPECVFGDPEDGHRKRRERLGKLVCEDDVRNNDTRKGPLGTHSIRKGAATQYARCGRNKDWVNRRGRWRGHKSIVDLSIYPGVPYPDACCATSLCGPLGPCMCVLREGAEYVTDTFLLEDVAPSIRAKLGDNIARQLALLLLWAALEDETSLGFAPMPQ